MSIKGDIEKFAKDNDFKLWTVRVQVVLTQQKALKGDGAFVDHHITSIPNRDWDKGKEYECLVS
jgi:hypothetical protein